MASFSSHNRSPKERKPTVAEIEHSAQQISTQPAFYMPPPMGGQLNNDPLHFFRGCQDDVPDEGILASYGPKWRWTNYECRTWLFKILTAFGGLDRADAMDLAFRFVGFGPTLFSMDEEAWKRFLGEPYGVGVYGFIFETRDHAGALPPRMTYPHFLSSPKYLQIPMLDHNFNY